MEFLYETTFNLPQLVAFQIDNIQFVEIPEVGLFVAFCNMWHMVGWNVLVRLPILFSQDQMNSIISLQETIYFIRTDTGHVLLVTSAYLHSQNIDLPW